MSLLIGWFISYFLIGSQRWCDRDLSCWQSWGVPQVRIHLGDPWTHAPLSMSWAVEYGWRALILGALKILKPFALCPFQATGWLCGPEFPNDFQYGTQRRHHSLRVRHADGGAQAWLCCCFCTGAWAGERHYFTTGPRPTYMCWDCKVRGDKTTEVLFSLNFQVSAFWKFPLRLSMALIFSTM
jgi:hypothetical protein